MADETRLIPAGPPTMVPWILQVLRDGPRKRSELRRHVDRLARLEGFRAENVGTLKKALRSLEDDGRVARIQYGWYEAKPRMALSIGNRSIEVKRPNVFVGSPPKGRQKMTAAGQKVFIGHGRSPVWRELKDFLQNRLHLTTDEFNSVSTAGVATSNRLEEMLNNAAFAFLILTAEDEQPDGTLRPRENVVHEAGLFQGRLGFEKAILLLEDTCEKFSNAVGLVDIPFPRGNIKAAFEQVREVLEARLPERKGRFAHKHSRTP